MELAPRRVIRRADIRCVQHPSTKPLQIFKFKAYHGGFSMANPNQFPEGARVVVASVDGFLHPHLLRHAKNADEGNVVPPPRGLLTAAYVHVRFEGCRSTHRFLPEELVRVSGTRSARQ
jgi:hypothetical protein